MCVSDGFRTEEERFGDLWICPPIHDEPGDLELALRKRFDAGPIELALAGRDQGSRAGEEELDAHLGRRTFAGCREPRAAAAAPSTASPCGLDPRRPAAPQDEPRERRTSECGLPQSSA